MSKSVSSQPILSPPPAWVNLVAGTFAGFGICLTGHPFDTIKVLLYTQSASNPAYKGMLDAGRQTLAKEGFSGLYKGVASPLVGMGLFNAVQFFSYGYMRNLFTANGKYQSLADVHRFFAAGAATGVIVAAIEGPYDLIKSQMQRQIGLAKAGYPLEYSGTADCVRSIVRSRGPQGLLQGYAATTLRNTIGVSMYFGFYEATKLAVTGNGRRYASSLEVFAAGGLGGFFYWLLAQPADVIKSQLQVDAVDPAKRTYRGWLDCARRILRDEGPRGFLRGLSPSMTRSIPANATGFLVFELTKDLLWPADQASAQGRM